MDKTKSRLPSINTYKEMREASDVELHQYINYVSQTHLPILSNTREEQILLIDILTREVNTRSNERTARLDLFLSITNTFLAIVATIIAVIAFIQSS